MCVQLAYITMQSTDKQCFDHLQLWRILWFPVHSYFINYTRSGQFNTCRWKLQKNMGWTVTQCYKSEIRKVSKNNRRKLSTAWNAVCWVIFDLCPCSCESPAKSNISTRIDLLFSGLWAKSGFIMIKFSRRWYVFY